VSAIPDGFDGLIWPEKSFELTLDRVSRILPRGGTILGTTNRGNPFKYKSEENGREVVRDISDDILANRKKLGIDASSPSAVTAGRRLATNCSRRK
jgi:6-phosphofructokinase 1